MKTPIMRSAAIAAVIVVAFAGPASADPVDPAGPDIQPAAAEAAPPIDDGKVASNPPITDKSPDGWVMTVGGKDEVQRAVAPLTTAISTREYQVSGTFTGSLKGAGGGPAKGVLEVGYQIGCGIEMTTGNGVIVSGNAGGAAGIGIGITPNLAYGDFLVPSIGASIGGGVAISLKPGQSTSCRSPRRRSSAQRRGSGSTTSGSRLTGASESPSSAPTPRWPSRPTTATASFPGTALPRTSSGQIAGNVSGLSPVATSGSRPEVSTSGSVGCILHWPKSGVCPPVQYGSVISGLADAAGAVSTAVATSRAAATRVFIASR